jgi:uncharacterized protein (DUF3084 family)
MSVIEDSRKVLQDFIAPELRAVDVRLAALEKRLDGFERQVDQRFQQVDQRFQQVDQRFDKMEQQIERKFDQLLAEIRSLKNVHELELRMAKYEAMLSSPGESTRQPKPESEAA